MKYLLLFSIINVSLFSNSILNTSNKHRYYGGISEIKAKIPTSVMLTPSTLVTEEVFAAKNNHEIDIAIIKQKKEQVKSAVQAKDFAMEKTGHLYGGISEGSLSF